MTRKTITLRGYCVKCKRTPKGAGFVHYAKWQILETCIPSIVEAQAKYPGYQLKFTPLYAVIGGR